MDVYSIYLTIPQAAKCGILPAGTLRRMLKNRDLPGFHVGTRFYINVPLLLDQLAAKSQMAGGALMNRNG